MTDKFSHLATWALVTDIIYLLWLMTVVRGITGYVYLVLEVGIFSLLLLFVTNHRSRRYVLQGGSYSLRGIVDVIITTKGEPAAMVERTVQAAAALSYPNLRIYVSDDGDNPAIKAIAHKYACDYLVRPDRQTKAYKAASLNYVLRHSFGNFILVLDADQQVQPAMLDDLLGHFKDEQLAYIATRQWFDVPDKDFNHDYLFYEYMQPGKGTSNAAISCGSGVIYRRSALLAVGGFSEWNVVEDLHTSYVLNAHGYKGIYTNQSYTNGVAPTDLPTIYKQRGTWALDSLRLMLWQVPRPQPLLSLTQKLHYFEMGYIYLVSAVMLPAIFFLNYYSLFFNVTFIAAGWWYLVFKLPAFFFTLKLYNDLGRGQSASRMWAALFPVYFRSLWLAMLYKKPVYQVTEKRRAPVPDQSLRLIWPQAMTVGLGIVAIVYHLAHFHFTSLLAVNFFWMGVILYWLWPIFPKAWASRGAV